MHFRTIASGASAVPFTKSLCGFAGLLLAGCASLWPGGVSDLPHSAVELERPSLVLAQLSQTYPKESRSGPFQLTKASLTEQAYTSPIDWFENYCKARGVATRGSNGGRPQDTRLLCTAAPDGTDEVLFVVEGRATSHDWRHWSLTLHEPVRDATPESIARYVYEGQPFRFVRPSARLVEEAAGRQRELDRESQYMRAPVSPGARVCRTATDGAKGHVEAEYPNGTIRVLLDDGRPIMGPKIDWTACPR